jgi:TPR repeat protein
MLQTFLPKLGRASAGCAICAYPTDNRICDRCVLEEGVVNYACVICEQQCGAGLSERVRLPCGDIVHSACEMSVDMIGKCPGACARRDNPDPTKIPSLQDDLIALVLYALRGGPPLVEEDLTDLADEEMFWVLRCIYAHGIGVPRDAEEEKKWLKKAIYQGDPQAQYYLATLKNDLKWLRRAADAGHPKAIRAMADHCVGKCVLGHTRPVADISEAKRYVSLGTDAACLCMQALDAVNHDESDAETKLRRARRENFSTESLFSKVTVELASIYFSRGQYSDALVLAASAPPTPDIYVSMGVTLAAIDQYNGNAVQDAMLCFIRAKTGDAYVCMAKMMQSNVVPGGPSGVDLLMHRAAEEGHPEAAFHFLQKRDCSAADNKKYLTMLRAARDKPFLIRCAVFFLRNGRPDLAAECKRIRLAL